MSKKSKIQQIQLFLSMFTGFIGVAIAITVSLVQHLDACQNIVDTAGYLHMAGHVGILDAFSWSVSQSESISLKCITMRFENVSAFTLAMIAFAPALILLFIHLPGIFFPKEKKHKKRSSKKKSRGRLECSAG